MSRIYPVEKPARRRHVSVESRAKEPEAQPRLVLDAEIVARGAALFAPPGAFDAFGSFRANHFVQGAAPAEAHRRAVRHEGEDVDDGLGLGEQTQRTRAQLSVGAEAAERIPAKLGARHGLRRHRRAGEFGDMAVTGDETRNPSPSEPRAQAIDQAVELGLIFTGAETDLLVRTGFGVEHREPRQIEAEARIDLVAERGEALDEERADCPRIAQRARGAGGDALDRAIGAEEGELETPRPLAARGQRRFEPRREPLDAREHIFLARDRLGKALLRDIARDRQTRGERFIFAPERAVELAQEIGAEAGGERRARRPSRAASAALRGATAQDVRARRDLHLPSHRRSAPRRKPRRWWRRWRRAPKSRTASCARGDRREGSPRRRRDARSRRYRAKRRRADRRR